jgi:hypothetical protein
MPISIDVTLTEKIIVSTEFEKVELRDNVQMQGLGIVSNNAAEVMIFRLEIGERAADNEGG